MTILFAGAALSVLAAGAAQAGSSPRQTEYATVEVVGFAPSKSGGYDAVGWGSGAMVDSSGLVLTAFHVVGDPQSGRLLNPDGLAGIAVVQSAGEAAIPSYLGRVVTYSPTLDLALIDVALRLDGTRLPAYTFFPALSLPGLRDRTPGTGDRLVAFGFATGFSAPAAVVTGTLARSGPLPGFGGTPLALTTTALYADGLTGGPVMNADGVLAGIALGMAGRSAGALGVVRPWIEARDWASGQVTTTQTPPPVAVAGHMVDLHTRRGITGGVLVILKPNVAVDDFVSDPQERDVAAEGETDAAGAFVTAPPVPFGVAYNMVVYAQGYRTAYSAQPILLDEHLCPSPTRCDLGTIELDNTQP